jgi:hypothetical protein
MSARLTLEPAVEQVRKALRSEGLPILVNEVKITDPAMAQRFGFLGSPSIRIDGIDVEPGAGDQNIWVWLPHVLR